MESRKNRPPHLSGKENSIAVGKMGLQQYVNLVSKSLELPVKYGELAAAKQSLKYLQRLEYVSEFEDLNYVVLIESFLHAVPKWLVGQRWDLNCDSLASIPTLKSLDKKPILYFKALAILISAFPTGLLNWRLEKCQEWPFS